MNKLQTFTVLVSTTLAVSSHCVCTSCLVFAAMASSARPSQPSVKAWNDGDKVPLSQCGLGLQWQPPLNAAPHDALGTDENDFLHSIRSKNGRCDRREAPTEQLALEDAHPFFRCGRRRLTTRRRLYVEASSTPRFSAPSALLIDVGPGLAPRSGKETTKPRRARKQNA